MATRCVQSKTGFYRALVSCRCSSPSASSVSLPFSQLRHANVYHGRAISNLTRGRSLTGKSPSQLSLKLPQQTIAWRGVSSNSSKSNSSSLAKRLIILWGGAALAIGAVGAVNYLFYGNGFWSWVCWVLDSVAHRQISVPSCNFCHYSQGARWQGEIC